MAELKLRVLSEFGGLGGKLDYCDPDQWPLADTRPELVRAQAAIDDIREKPQEYLPILAAEHISEPLSDDEVVIVYGDYKEMEYAIRLRGSGDELTFVLGRQNDSIHGTVTRRGDVRETRRDTNEYGCPVCLARNTRIAVPGGFVPVQVVRVGMTVWSTDALGRRIRAVVERVGRTPVPPTHSVVRLVLADGRTVLVSPGHPTPDGTPVGALRSDARFEGSRVISAELVPYAGEFTFDLLPSGTTGTYFANGVLLGSTLVDEPRSSSG